MASSPLPQSPLSNDSSPPPPTSASLSIDHIRTLTDVGTMTRLLHESIAHHRQLDLHLSSLPPVPSLPPLHHLLNLLSSDSSLLLSTLLSTSSLADSVSSKVRQLDLAQSRVSSTLLHLNAITDRSRCLELMKNSLADELNPDLSTAAESCHRFLSIDAEFGRDKRMYEEMMALKKHLEGIVRRRLTNAVDQRNHAEVVKFVRLFSPLGLEVEGLQAYVNYLRKVIGMRSRIAYEQLLEMMQQQHQQQQQYGDTEDGGFGGDRKVVNFVGCLTDLFKDIVLAIEENDEILRGLCGDDGVAYAVCELQEESDSRGSAVVKKYMEYRKLGKVSSEINAQNSNLIGVGSASQGPDPREIEVYLEEILSLMQLGQDYTEFMISKIKGLSSVKPEVLQQATKSFRSGSFSKVVQEITGYYVILEGFFMVENVRKAIRIDEHVFDSLTSSMVDDVFYVLQSCLRRAISTSNISSVIAILSGAGSLLGNEYHEALQFKMREPNLGARLFLGGVGVQKTGTEIATALNNMDVSSEYVLKLKHEIEEQCAEVFPAPADRERVKSCLSELGDMSNSFKQALEAGLEQLMATIAPRIRPVLDGVATISYELSEAEYADNEINDPWVQRLLHAVEMNVAWLQLLMTANNYDSFVHLTIDFIVKRLEVIMMQKRFSQLGGLQLDRDVRALVSHFSSMTQRTVRDKFARITQMATILNLEKVSEILDFWGENSGPMTWRLTPAEVRRVLGLRVDFKPEAISALKL
ncbi:hypothetical protein MLD38_015876 [Melastoma candidum]|uniref:Uncharacterized protein n=2 Tax=Melastoma candidum TaxID=119954 RepID=A0ACB9RGU9_9MYRT|nr:hypothetical protein MLD38_015876 [Melastoma candidum]